MNDPRQDKITRERLDTIEAGYQERADTNQSLIRELGVAYRKFSRRTTRILLGVALLLLVSGYLNYYLIGQNNKRADEIQQQRYSTVFGACDDQNHRRERTIQKLTSLLDHVPANEKARAKASKKFTVALIDTLVPRRNCKLVAKEAVHPPNKAPGG